MVSKVFEKNSSGLFTVLRGRSGWFTSAVTAIMPEKTLQSTTYRNSNTTELNSTEIPEVKLSMDMIAKQPTKMSPNIFNNFKDIIKKKKSSL